MSVMFKVMERGVSHVQSDGSGASVMFKVMGGGCQSCSR